MAPATSDPVTPDHRYAPGRIHPDPAEILLARGRHGRVIQLGTQGQVLFYGQILREENANLPKVRCNLRNTNVVMMSMQQTPILDNFEKDKKSERRSISQKLATHLSDTEDYTCVPNTAPGLAGWLWDHQ